MSETIKTYREQELVKARRPAYKIWEQVKRDTKPFKDLASDLGFMVDFQEIIMQMQLKQVDYAIKNPKATLQIQEGIKRIDALIEIYDKIDRFYFNINLYQQKCSKLGMENLELYKMVAEQKAEIDRLNKTIDWNGEA